MFSIFSAFRNSAISQNTKMNLSLPVDISEVQTLVAWTFCETFISACTYTKYFVITGIEAFISLKFIKDALHPVVARNLAN